ncbi:MAG: anthranilate synthase component I [Methanomassiliicoccaceae archaeon]|nr:anthranilate synthase component I [Methanomassiliicoccaceae archaeon]
MIRPTLEETKNIASFGKYDVVPLSTELYADTATPIEVLRKLMKVSGHCFILESVEDNKRWGRYTFLGFDPRTEITCSSGLTKIRCGSETRTERKDPNECIREILKKNRSVRFPDLPPFTGGLVGYFSYDHVKYSEPSLILNAKDDEHFNDFDLMLFDKVVAFDHYRQKIVLIVNVRTESIEDEYKNGVRELKCLKKIVTAGEPERTLPARLGSEFKALFSEKEFCGIVEKAKEYIREGEIFQVVLSNRYEAEFEGCLLDAYRIMRTTNPSPYMFYFRGENIEIAGASPETLVKLQDGKISTFPLAGTRPRGSTDKEDEELEKELLSDEKELAEHNMLVDLGRNDLGIVSRTGSVSVERYMSILRYSHVMHIGSAVSGEIRDDKNGLDAVNAVLPAGTLSGAPKIRAMEIIDELEGERRGIYGGAIGYLDLTGNMDTCIAIRIAYKKNGKVFVRSGAGIVADSDPRSEYKECMNKSKAAMNAVIMSAGGVDP